MKKALVAATTAALTLALGLFAGAALAGGGHGGGHGNGSDPQQQHGNGSNDQGVKPSSTTEKDTHARADSDRTKQYGNGKTAGKIVMQKGAPGDTDLHGPGNSQPHKVTDCRHRHEVDVHAYKGGGACASAAPEHGRPAKEHARPAKEQEHGKPAPAPTHAVAPARHEQRKVWICHSTGSATNPYVLIHVSANALPAHTRHHDGHDIVLGDTAGSGCPPPRTETETETHAAAAVSPQTTTSTVEATTTVGVTATVEATTTVTTTVTVPETTTTTETVQGGVAGVSTTTPTGGETPQGGVLGAQATLPQPKPRGSVLGTIGNATLPFTGIPLLPVVLAALAAVALGLGFRRSQRSGA